MVDARVRSLNAVKPIIFMKQRQVSGQSMRRGEKNEYVKDEKAIEASPKTQFAARKVKTRSKSGEDGKKQVKLVDQD